MTRSRYEIQTRAGLEWGWYAGAADVATATARAADARKTGYVVRVLDRRHGTTLHLAHGRNGLALVSAPA